MRFWRSWWRRTCRRKGRSKPRPGFLILLLAGVAAGAGAGPNAFEARVQLGTIQDAAISETSGVAASCIHPGVLWIHNDSGGMAHLFAVNEAGALLGTYSITGASAVDWEDIAIATDSEDGRDYLYIGDIGDNTAVRSAIQVYKVEEPDVDTNTTGVVTNLPDLSCRCAPVRDRDQPAGV